MKHVRSSCLDALRDLLLHFTWAYTFDSPLAVSISRSEFSLITVHFHRVLHTTIVLILTVISRDIRTCTIAVWSTLLDYNIQEYSRNTVNYNFAKQCEVLVNVILVYQYFLFPVLIPGFLVHPDEVMTISLHSTQSV